MQIELLKDDEFRGRKFKKGTVLSCNHAEGTERINNGIAKQVGGTEWKTVNKDDPKPKKRRGSNQNKDEKEPKEQPEEEGEKQ